ncbi:MAG: sigma-70 family RNA polymerase sigma factor [Pirellulaceae bacterium]|nr:sigma-70 family RNA polymerase sigma factor [Pirellulaceae bacterium]
MSTLEIASTPSTSNSLLQRACEGEPIAWQKLVQLHGPMIYVWARRTGLQPHDAADVTQETFAAVHARLPRFEPNRGNSTFRGWLWTITRNKAADCVRRRLTEFQARGGSTNMAMLDQQVAGQSLLSDSHAEVETSVAEDESDRRGVIERAMAILRQSFEDQTWQAFWRTVVDGCSPDEVAIELGMSRWAVYKARTRILQRLRTELHGLEDLS